ncbi:MAG TPA: hypothetical protein PLQ36_02105 [Candidatus Gracilibacteria bacterium]|nr:hypothetical protein [Candidatus Gracilibacteria bacterium]
MYIYFSANGEANLLKDFKENTDSYVKDFLNAKINFAEFLTHYYSDEFAFLKNKVFISKEYISDTLNLMIKGKIPLNEGELILRSIFFYPNFVFMEEDGDAIMSNILNLLKNLNIEALHEAQENLYNKLLNHSLWREKRKSFWR